MREDWVECTFGEIIYFKNGFAFKSSDYIDDGVPIIRIGDINQNQITIEDSKRVKELNDLDEYLIKKGDILIAMSGATTGKFGMYNLDGKAYLNQRVGNIFPISSELVYKPFLFFLLHFLKRQIEKDAYGGAQPNISSKKIEEMKVPFIPLPEQRAIVKKIEALFSSLDAGISDLKKAQEQLKIYRQAVLKKAFEGEYKEVTLKDIILNISQGWSPKCLNTSRSNSDEWAVIKTTAIQHGAFKESENKILPTNLEPRIKHEIREGDVLITRAGPRVRVGVCCVVRKTTPRLINCDKVYKLELNQNILNSFFFEKLLNSSEYIKKIDFIKTGGSDSGVNLTQDRFLSLTIPLPSLEEQTQIVKEIEARLSVCDAVEKQIQDSLDQAEALRQSILKKAFEGRLLNEEELNLCKQAPDYEPASVLLAKIKAEKEANKAAKKKTTKKK